MRIESSTGSVSVRLPDAGYAVRTRTCTGEADVRVITNPAAPRSLDLETSTGNIIVGPN
ncbi:hypothetical protein [Pseudonocardia sp. GCM10023141]|uniref:hypothetical protein n=1 Tax=Pseudonocardia sp. GCM10023141 TaxID=3252653 RepID=UPI0036215052